MYIIVSNGTKSDPRGTAHAGSIVTDLACNIFTDWVLSEEKELKYSLTIPTSSVSRPVINLMSKYMKRTELILSVHDPFLSN